MDAVSFILMLMMAAQGSSGGNALTTARFETRAACEAAGKEGKVAFESMYREVSYRCVPTR